MARGNALVRNTCPGMRQTCMPTVLFELMYRKPNCREVLEGCNELRLMLCREKFQGNKRGTSVIAACGEPDAVSLS